MATLGSRVHYAGNTIRYVIEYDQWLQEGESLKAPCTVAVAAQTPPITDVTITGITTTPSNEIVFLMGGGSANEVFTLNVLATNSRNEVKNDTIEFSINTP